MQADSWIRQNITLENEPCGGSTYITPEGKFANLESVGWEHLDLMNHLSQTFGIEPEEDEVIPGLQSNGWIRCNEGTTGYAYIELRGVQPTPQQQEAIEKWIDFVLQRRPEVSVVYLTDDEYEEETYGQTVSGRDIMKSIQRVYNTGSFIPASAFEGTKGKGKEKQPESIPELKITWSVTDDGYGTKIEGYHSDIDGGYVDPNMVDFYKKHGIIPQLAQRGHGTCSIGFSEKEQKWYGWSHRAIAGFEVGHVCKADDAGVEIRSDRSPVWYPKPGFKCKTLEDCKNVAIAFADSVS